MSGQPPPRPRVAVQPRSRRRRLVTLAIILFVALGAGAFGAWRYFTGSAFLGPIVEDLLADATGGEVTVGAARYVGDGRVELEDVVLRAPGLDGPAGKLIVIDAADIDVDLSGFFSGTVEATRCEIHDAVVRISEDEATGVLNFSLLQFDGGGDGGRTPIPVVELNRAIIEVGSSLAGRYQPSGSITVNGSLHKDTSPAASPEQMLLQLEEIGSHSEPGPEQGAVPLAVRGRLNVADGTASVQITGLRFHPGRRDILPMRVQTWWNTVNPSGQLNAVAIDVTSSGDYFIEIPMDGVDWSLPLFDPASQPDVEQPRMTNVRGTVRLTDAGVQFINVSGEIDSIRYEIVRGSFASFEPETQLDLALDVRGLDPTRSLDLLTVLPENVRTTIASQILRLGGGSSTLNAQIVLHRDPPAVLTEATETSPADFQAAPLKVSGTLQIENAEVVYQKLPYPLYVARGEVQFTQDQIRVVGVPAQGPTGASVLIRGVVDELGAHPRVNLDVEVVNLPLDDYALGAINPRYQDAIRRFIHAPTADALRAAGVFVDPLEGETLRNRLMLALAELQTLAETEVGGDAEAVETARRRVALAEEIEALEEQLILPHFRLGGIVRVVASVQRDSGPDQPTKVTARITPDRPGRPVGLLYRKFPYPLQVVDGELLITWEKIEITRDLVAVAPNGAAALISGHADRIRQGETRRIDPHLRITASNVPIDAFLLHAIPGKVSDEAKAQGLTWPGSALTIGAEILAGLRLGGRATVEAAVSPGPEGRPEIAVRAGLEDGASLADGATAVPLRETLWRWPTGLPLTDVSAELSVSQHDVLIHAIRGVSDGATVEASGDVAWSASGATFDIALACANLPYGDHLADLMHNLADPSQEARLAEFTSVYHPQGTFDFDLRRQRILTGESQHVDEVDLFVRPRDLSLVLGGKRIGLLTAAGDIEIVPDGVEFNTYEGTLFTSDGDRGRVALSGYYDPDSRAESRLTGKIDSVRFESSLIPALVEEFAEPEDLALFRSLDLAGLCDATLALGTAASEGDDWRLTLEPDDLDLTWNGERFELRRVQGTVGLTPGRTRFDALRGGFQDGEFDVTGEIRRSPDRMIDLALDVTADAASPRIRAFLPPVLHTVIDGLKVEFARPWRLHDARLIRRGPTDFDPQEPWTSTTFAGTLELEDAAVDVSIPITQINGSMAIDLHADVADPLPRFTLDMQIDECFAMRREMTDVALHMQQGDRPGVYLLTALSGDCYGGRIEGHGRFNSAEAKEPGAYELTLTAAAVDVRALLDSDRESAEAAAPTGRVFASYGVRGILGNPATRRGRGSIRILDAQLYRVPLAMFALQLSALTIPASTSFNFADMAFFVDGNYLVFERLFLESPTVTLTGGGYLDYAAREVNLSFRSQGLMRAPLLSDIWDEVRNRILTIHVTGPIESPVTELRSGGLVPLPPRDPARQLQSDDFPVTTPETTGAPPRATKS